MAKLRILHCLEAVGSGGVEQPKLIGHARAVAQFGAARYVREFDEPYQHLALQGVP